jgi:hypothetical protein
LQQSSPEGTLEEKLPHAEQPERHQLKHVEVVFHQTVDHREDAVFHFSNFGDWDIERQREMASLIR